MKFKVVLCVSLGLLIASFATAQISKVPAGLPRDQTSHVLRTFTGSDGPQEVAPGPTALCSLTPKGPFTNWAQYQFDSCHSGYNRWEFLLNSSNVSNLVLDWSNYTGPIGGSSPTVANGMVYIATAYERQGPQYLCAFDARSGALIWTFQEEANGPVRSSAAVAGGVVYYGGNPGLYALNATTGVPIWSIPTDSFVASPAIADGVVYAAWQSGSDNNDPLRGECCHGRHHLEASVCDLARRFIFGMRASGG